LRDSDGPESHRALSNASEQGYLPAQVRLWARDTSFNRLDCGAITLLRHKSPENPDDKPARLCLQTGESCNSSACCADREAQIASEQRVNAPQAAQHTLPAARSCATRSRIARFETVFGAECSRAAQPTPSALLRSRNYSCFTSSSLLSFTLSFFASLTPSPQQEILDQAAMKALYGEPSAIELSKHLQDQVRAHTHAHTRTRTLEAFVLHMCVFLLRPFVHTAFSFCSHEFVTFVHTAFSPCSHVYFAWRSA